MAMRSAALALLSAYAEADGMPNGTGNTVMFAPYTLCAHARPGCLNRPRPSTHS